MLYKYLIIIIVIIIIIIIIIINGKFTCDYIRIRTVFHLITDIFRECTLVDQLHLMT